MTDWISILTMALQAVIAAVLAAFTTSMQRNRTTLDAIAAQISALAVSMAKMSSTQDGFEKRFDQHVRDTERRLGLLEEHMLLVRTRVSREQP
jgi:hypothetical protein